MTVTIWQLRMLRLFKEAAAATGHQTFTLHHRGESGSVQTTAAGNDIVSARVGNPTLEPTTDYTVYVSLKPIRVRGGSSDAGDGPAGRQWTERAFVQICALDAITKNPIQLADEDWIDAPDGTKWRIENPSPAADGASWTASAISQRG